MSKKQKILAGVVAVIVIGSSFYTGMMYGKKSCSPFSRNGQMGGQMQARMRQPGAVGFAGMDGRTGNKGGFVSGQIISKDDKSVTVKLSDGGSKIIFVGASTSVTKSVGGTVQDLSVGGEIMANGTANSDGSITAQTIQIKPPQTK